MIPIQRQVVLKWVRILCGVQSIEGQAVVTRVNIRLIDLKVLVGTAKAYGERLEENKTLEYKYVIYKL